MVAKAKLSIVSVSDKSNPFKELSIRPLRTETANEMIWNLKSSRKNTIATRWELNGMQG